MNAKAMLEKGITMLEEYIVKLEKEIKDLKNYSYDPEDMVQCPVCGETYHKKELISYNN